MIQKKILFIGIATIFIIIIIIIFISIFTKNKKVIILPLNIESEIKDIFSPIPLFDNNIRTTIKISNKEQEVDIFLLSKGYSFFITQADIFYENNNKSEIKKYSKNFYDDKISNSIIIKSNKTKVILDRYLIGKQAEESFFLCSKDNCNSNSVSLTNFTFMLAENPFDKISGGIGLRFNEYIIEGVMNFINELNRKKYIDYPVWYIDYDEKDKSIGKYIIGKYPHEINKKYKKSNILFNEIYNINSNNMYWYLEMEEIYINGEKIKEIKEIIFEFTPDLGGIYGSPIFYNKLKQKFFNEYLNNRLCVENFVEYESEYKYIYCDKSVNIKNFPTIKIENYFKYTFELSYNELFNSVEDRNIFLFFTDKNENYFNNKWKIGEPFLRKYLVVFDQKNKWIGFYINKSTFDYTFINEIGLLLLIIGSVIAIFLCFVIYRRYKLRKIKKNALEMNINDNLNRFI